MTRPRRSRRTLRSGEPNLQSPRDAPSRKAGGIMSLSPDDNRDREQDLVKVYLSQMSVIPPISVEEERVLACELEESRGWYRERIMRSALALSLTVRLLDKIVSGQLPVDRVLLIEANDNAKKERIRADLGLQLPVVRRDISWH